MIIAAGIATAFNFLIIYWKFKRKRIPDALLDLGIFIAICFLFQSTFAGMQVGMIASFIVSIFLLVFPPMPKGAA